MPWYWFGRRIAPLKHEWEFLANNSLPHYVGTQIPPYYKDILELFHNMDLSKLSQQIASWTTDNFYSQFMTKHKHLPRAYQDFWSAHKVDPKTMWKHIFISYALGCHQDVHYRLLHRVLPTQAYMHLRFRGKGYANVDTSCQSCPNAVETNEHVFFRCRAATPLLTFIYPSIQLLLQDKPFKLFKLALNIFPAGVPVRQQQMAITILQITLHTIWRNRNKFKFESVRPTVAESTHFIGRVFNSILQEQFDSYRNNGLVPFRNKYCHTPRICSVQPDGTLSVNLI